MIVVSSAEHIQTLSMDYHHHGKIIGFVPTMGALHNGHLSLIKRSQSECDITVVSIFVNPKQFGPKEDFEKYPRTLDADIKLLNTLSPDVLFTPDLDAIYTKNLDLNTLHYDLPKMAEWYCGKSRPGHFQGVCAVVKRFFDLVMPHSAYFGEKDYQQFALISQMVRDLSLPIRIVGCPILREASGLAMSSRNRYLSAQELIQASTIYSAFLYVYQDFLENHLLTDDLRQTFLSHLSSAIEVEYIDIVDPFTLEPQEEARFKDRILFAGRIGSTRLIDNYSLSS